MESHKTLMEWINDARLQLIEVIQKKYKVIDASENFISNCENCNYMSSLSCDDCIEGTSENCVCDFYKVSICYNCVGLILSELYWEVIFKNHCNVIRNLSQTQEWNILKELLIALIKKEDKLMEMFHAEMFHAKMFHAEMFHAEMLDN